MRRNTRSELAISTYVVLFVIAPVGLFLYKVSPGHAGIVLIIILGWLIMAIECVDLWLRLWGLGKDRKSEKRPKPGFRLGPRLGPRRNPPDFDPQRRRGRPHPGPAEKP